MGHVVVSVRIRSYFVSCLELARRLSENEMSNGNSGRKTHKYGCIYVYIYANGSRSIRGMST